jgi:hypothetical protein
MDGQAEKHVNPLWRYHFFTEREQKEIAFAQIYFRDFNHGTDGHNAKVIIAKMAALLDDHYLLDTALTSDSGNGV